MTDETPPVEAPPADTPPVETPPVEAEKPAAPWNKKDKPADAPTPSAADLAAHAGSDPQAAPVRPIEELTTPHPEDEPEAPGVFVPSDQTAGGYLTPEGARNPGMPTQTNPLDPFNVNNGNIAYHQAVRDNATRGTNRNYVPPADAPVEPSEPPAGTPLTAEERAANGLPPLEDEQPEPPIA